MRANGFYGQTHKNNRNQGHLLLEGELVTEAEEHVVTCGRSIQTGRSSRTGH
jgi:hypothetical protein